MLCRKCLKGKKTTMKKALSVILSLLMLLSASSIAFAANAAEAPKAQAVENFNAGYADFVSSLVIPTAFEAHTTLDKSNYVYGDEIKITLDLVNGTDYQLDTLMVRNKLSHKSLTISDNTDLRQTVMAPGASCTKYLSAYRVPTTVGAGAVYQVNSIIEELSFFFCKLIAMIPGSRVLCASDLVYFTYASIPMYMHTYVFTYVSDNQPASDEPDTPAVPVDSLLDQDGNGIPDCIENEDYTTDTDGDGLTDYEELVYCNTNPLLVDTDGDGLNDADSDSDEDTLSNKDELLNVTNPLKPDTDDDYLNDADELAAGTDPVNPDTDGDGAKDGWELNNNYDPLTADDSFTIEAFSTSAEQTPAVTASVVMTVAGEQTDTLRIKEVTAKDNALISGNIPGYMGNAYDFSISGNVDDATLTFCYDASAGEAGDDFQPRIYYLNEADGTLEELPDQVVEDGKVKAAATHFSTYLLLNKVEFDKVWRDDIKSPILDANGQQSGIDVAFVIDVSGSMDWDNRLPTAKSALYSFLDALEDEDRAALVKFSEYSTVVSGLTDDIASVRNKVSGLSANGLTSMYRGLGSAIDILTASGVDYGYKMIVVLSDGYDEPSVSYASNYAGLVQKAKDNDITIYTVGAGSTLDTSVLTRIANETGGSYYEASQTAGIIDAFNYVQENTVDVKSDTHEENGKNDGIPDYFADLIFKGELVLGNGSAELKGVDLNASIDLDGDGLLNGEEIKVVEKDGRVYLQYLSSPVKADTDEDGINDKDDTDRMRKGLAGGVMGELTIVALPAGGHSWLVYKSYVADTVDISGLNAYYSYDAAAKAFKGKAIGAEKCEVEMKPGSCISVGNFGQGTNNAQILLASIFNKARGGICVNQEFAVVDDYSQNASGYSKDLSRDGLNDILSYCRRNNYYNAFTHNCTYVAVNAWNTVFDSDAFASTVLPGNLRREINKKAGSNPDYGTVMTDIVSDWQ